MASIVVGIVASPAWALTTEKFSFQPDDASTPSGYTKDVGAAYNTTTGFGWVREDSLDDPAHVPLDLTLNTRAREAVADLRQDSFIHMQFPMSSSSSGTKVDGAWERALANGTYTVTVGVGDADYYDSINRIRAEGQTIIAGYVASSSAPFEIASGTVTVTDGRLTIDAVGGTNTKLDFVDIVEIDGPPGVPSVVSAAAHDGSVSVRWQPNGED